MKELIIKKGDKQITVADKEDVMDALDNKSDNTHNHDGTYIKSGGTSSQFLKANGSVFDISTHNQGGTNLLQGTQNFNGAKGLLQRYVTGTYRNLEYVLVNNSSQTSYTDISFLIPANTFDYGEKYTLSFWANGSGEIRVYNFGNTNFVKTKVINCTSGGIGSNYYNDGSCIFNLDNSGWKRYFVTWELNPTSNSSNDLNVDKYIILRTMAGATAHFAGVMYERGEIPHDWSPSPLDNSNFDFSRIKGTDNTVGYIKALRLQIGSAYQDKPIKIETYQRNRKTTNTINIAFQSVNGIDPSISNGFFSYYGDENFKAYLYKESAGVWSLITSKGHSNKYGEMMVKVSNPNPGVYISKLDTHIASLPSSTSTNPLMEANYIDFSSTEKTKLAGIATGANKTTIINDLTTGGTGSALSAEQGKNLKSLVDGKITNGTGTVTSTNIADKTIVNGDIADATITGGKLVDGTITNAKIGNNQVNNAKLSDNAITTAKITDANVTTAKIADSAVTSAKIADKTIVNGDIADNAAIAYSKLSGVVASTDYRLTDKRKPYNNSIAADSNLNNFTDAGFYYCQGDVEVAPTIVNQPLTSNQRSFSMIVELISSTRVVQKLTYYYTKDTYIRTNINGEWSTWNCVLHSGNYSNYANKTTIANNLKTSTAGSALDATQGKWLYDNKIEKAGTNLSKSGTTLNHATSGSGALTTATLKKITFDAQGHITGTADPNSVACTVTDINGNTSTINLVTR